MTANWKVIKLNLYFLFGKILREINKNLLGKARLLNIFWHNNIAIINVEPKAILHIVHNVCLWTPNATNTFDSLIYLNSSRRKEFPTWKFHMKTADVVLKRWHIKYLLKQYTSILEQLTFLSIHKNMCKFLIVTHWSNIHIYLRCYSTYK